MRRLLITKKRGGLWARLAAFMVVLMMTTAHGKLMAQTEISTEEGLRTLLQSGGTGTLTADITATSCLSVANSVTVTLNGNGHVLSVPVTGADEIGVLNDDASYFTLLSNSGNLTINDLTLRGGKMTCVNNSSGASLKMVGCTIERSGSDWYSGGGLKNYSKCYLKNCKISRNNANYGGGFLNGSSGILVFDGCSINENRSLSSSGGGGGGENQYGSTLIVNNCTFANNTSTEIGGAINQYNGDTYVLNSTFVGNISDSYYSASGGAFGMNGGSLYFVNSLMVNNYESKSDSFTDSDLGLFNGTPNFFQYSCYGTVLKGNSVFAPPTPTGWTGSVNAATTGVFSSYRSSAILNPDGTSSETLFNRPIIYQCSKGTYTAPIKAGSTPTTGGVATYLSVPDDVSTFSTSTIKLGYGETPTKIGNFEVAEASDKVTTYQDGTTRGNGVMGSSPIDGTEYVTLTLTKCNNGTVSGDGSLYGDSYPKGKSVSVTATPNAGFMFSGWKVNDSEEVQVTDNPYSFNINSDTKLEAVFEIKPVCKNLSTNIEYGTVQEAVNAAENGHTIKMLANSTEDVTISGKAITLDLNGNNLEKKSGSNAITVSNGSLTIKDTNTGTVGGVNGDISKDDSSTVKIEGGKYSFDPTPFLDINHAAKPTGTQPYIYEVVSDPDLIVCNDGTHSFTTLQQAIEFQTEETTIELSKDITENLTIAIDKDITLDLKGKTITSANGNTVIANNGTLTVIDSSDGNGIITGATTNYAKGIDNNGTLNLYAGNVTGNAYGVADYNNLTVGGKAVISLNGPAEGRMDLCLPDNTTFTIATGDHAPAETMLVGITTQTPPSSGNDITLTGNNGEDYSQHFFGDNSKYSVINTEGNVLKLTNEVKILISADPMDGGEVKLYKAGTTEEIEDPEHILYGTAVTITATPSGDYAFAGWYDKDSGMLFSKIPTCTFDAIRDYNLEARFTDQVIWVKVKKGN